SMAAREAFNGAPGPVYLEIPRDVLDREVEISKAIVPKPGHYRASTRSLGDPRDIEKLADLLVNSERPAILYGQQVWAARGHEEAIALLRGLDIPGYFNGGSRGLLPPGDPPHFERTRGNAFSDADPILIGGTPSDFRMRYGPPISTKLKLLQTHMDYRTGGTNGDVVTISAQAVRPRRPGQWMDPGALGSLGVGTGFAIAAGLAQPRKEVLCYYGDGSFGMTAFDMETANRFGVPYIAVIGNNSAM